MRALLVGRFIVQTLVGKARLLFVRWRDAAQNHIQKIFAISITTSFEGMPTPVGKMTAQGQVPTLKKMARNAGYTRGHAGTVVALLWGVSSVQFDVLAARQVRETG
jgi:hypothetical protein